MGRVAILRISVTHVCESHARAPYYFGIPHPGAESYMQLRGFPR
jgi:hypothetical protein